MPVLTLKEAQVIRGGEYHAKVTAISEVTGQYGDQYKIELTIRLRDGSTTTLTTWASQKYTSAGAKSSKLYTYAMALFNGNPPRELDPMVDFLGKTAIASVVVETKADGGEVNRVHSLLPIPRQSAPPRPTPKPAAPPPPAEDDDADAYWQRIYSDGPAGVDAEE